MCTIQWRVRSQHGDAARHTLATAANRPRVVGVACNAPDKRHNAGCAAGGAAAAGLFRRMGGAGLTHARIVD
ncbi:hypothetical protein FOB30_00515 [Burkholderia multivorans]|nr:hypothetical protein FOB30_00515 [Burkholderia multivorans]